MINYGHVSYKFEYQLKDKDGNLQTLPVDTKEKDLGIWFQNKLKFDEHINYVVNKANRLFWLGPPWLIYWFSFTLAYSRISHEYSSLFIIVINLIFMFSL